jgi:mRNA interferase MazF
MKVERGDIIIYDFGNHMGSSVQEGIRPAVVVSNDKANRNSPVITVVPLSCRIHKKRYLPTHVFIPCESAEGLQRHSMALAEQVTSIDCKYIKTFLEQDFKDVDIKEMTDLKSIKIDRGKSRHERQKSYLDKVINPYLVRIGNMKVKVRFASFQFCETGKQQHF